MCSLKSNLRYVIIASDNSVVPNRQQTIIWTSHGLVYRCVYASLGLSEPSPRKECWCWRFIQFIYFYLLVCINIFKPLMCFICILSLWCFFIVFILCIHWPATMCTVYGFNRCVFYHVLGQRWANKRVQSIDSITNYPFPQLQIIWVDAKLVFFFF